MSTNSHADVFSTRVHVIMSPEKICCACMLSLRGSSMADKAALHVVIAGQTLNPATLPVAITVPVQGAPPERPHGHAYR